MLKNNIKLIASLTTIIITAIIVYISIYTFGAYGYSLFIITPLLIGFLPPFIVGRVKRIRRKESFSISFLTLGAVLIGFLLFAIEGLICIAMASPIIVPATFIGSYLGYKINAGKWVNKTNISIITTLITIGSMSFDVAINNNNLIPVKTKLIINAPINEVWNNVVTFNKIEEPDEWLFKTGIAYPTDATIEGEKENAIRYCNFTTGSFVEPITTWDEPHLLQFDVIEQPIPMNEFNPFWEIHPPHLDGYFLSQKGQFKLKEIDANKTELEGTTWYKLNISPQLYWKTWSDFIIHKIHLRVLNHIKKQSEE